MSWSSSRAGVHSQGEGTVERLPAAEWTWRELGAEGEAASDEGPTPEEIEAREARRREEELVAAFERGRREGERAGEARARRELETAVEAALEVRARLDAVTEQHAEALHENLCALAVAIARMVVDRELETSPDTVADLVRGAVAAFAPDQPLKIRLNPVDLSHISVVSGEAGGGMNITGARDVRWTADPALAPGGCVVEGPDRVVDGRVDRVLERIYWTLKDAGRADP